jgi:hypothetical protein
LVIHEFSPFRGFKFDKVDLDLSREVKLLDERFEKEGLVYHDPPLKHIWTSYHSSQRPKVTEQDDREVAEKLSQPS